MYDIGNIELNDGNHDDTNLHVPRLIQDLSHLTIAKIAIHPDGYYALGVTVTGELYSWGE